MGLSLLETSFDKGTNLIIIIFVHLKLKVHRTFNFKIRVVFLFRRMLIYILNLMIINKFNFDQ